MKKTALLICVSLLALPVSAQQKNPKERWDVFAEDTAVVEKPNTVELAQADKVEPVEVVIYRVSSTKKMLPINIYVDGRYHASLLEDAYTSVRLCPGVHNFYVTSEGRLLNKNIPLLTKNNQTVDSSAAVGYYKLSNVSAQLEAVDPTTAQQEIPRISRLQTHTISRFIKGVCGI